MQLKDYPTDLLNSIQRDKEEVAEVSRIVQTAQLQTDIRKLEQQIEEAKNCLVCAAIADPLEVCKNTLDILEGNSYARP